MFTHILDEVRIHFDPQSQDNRLLAKKLSSNNSDSDIDVDDNMVDIDEFAQFKGLSKISKNKPVVDDTSVRKRSYSKEDVKISKNVIMNTGVMSPEYSISDQEDKESEK